MQVALPRIPITAAGRRLTLLARRSLIPLLGVAAFLIFWAGAARSVETSLGTFPGPAEVWSQAGNLWQEHLRERSRETAFYERQQARNDSLAARDPDAPIRWRDYTGKPTFFDQIATSLSTVAVGFLLAAAVAVPLGIVCGLSEGFYAAVNPVIQVFKPVSPLAWPKTKNPTNKTPTTNPRMTSNPSTQV